MKTTKNYEFVANAVLELIEDIDDKKIELKEAKTKQLIYNTASGVMKGKMQYNKHQGNKEKITFWETTPE